MAARNVLGYAALELGIVCFVNIPTSFCLSVNFTINNYKHGDGMEVRDCMRQV
jgi:hypothetical protein